MLRRGLRRVNIAWVVNRHQVRLGETMSGRELATFSPPFPGQIIGAHGLTFSSEGKWLVAAKDDGEVIGWELPKVRAELVKLGLWQTNSALNGGEKNNGSAVDVAHAEQSAVRPLARDTRLAPLTGIRSFAFAAAGLAVLAGGFVFAVQRRMIRSYEQGEALAEVQRQKLQTAQDELLHSQKIRALGTLAAVSRTISIISFRSFAFPTN